MENFNLKQYIYEKRVEGMTDGRIAETLGVTVNEMNNLLNPKPPKASEKKAKVEEKKPEPPKPPAEKKKPEEVKEPDPSWLED